MSENLTPEELAARFLERREAGEELTEEEFIAEYPEHAGELRDLLELMRDMDRFNPDRTMKIAPEGPGAARTNLPDSDYRLVRKLGSGGMGVVFEAVQLSLNRRVAVKLLNSSLLTSPEQRTQFENEARVIAMLHHPNIVKIYSAGCSEERCYYAMELVDGKGLDRCRFADLRELARIALQAAQALAYAHRCGVLHRDVKPANMLLDAEGNVHISDFGIAFILNGKEPVVEARGSRSGTLRYMAPERLANGVNTFATDQYSFGATFYELATGKPLLHSESQEDLTKRICSAPVDPLSCDEPEFAAIIDKCLSFDPRNRYAGMDDAAEDLQRFLNREPVRAFASSPWHRFKLWCRRKPAVAAMTFAAVGCAAAFVISLIVGYLQTRAALRLAERNAQVADSAISKIFRRISEQTASKKNIELLSALLPYYQTIVRQRNIPASRIGEAYGVIGECAQRSGNYAMAEEAFRNMLKYRSDAWSANRLAAVLKKQGKKAEADRLSREVVAKFGDSPVDAERFEAVRALLALSGAPESDERSRAFRILEHLLKNQPKNPEYRFLYAVLLGGSPRLYHSLRIPGVEPNAVKLLAKLADEHPDQPEYGLALIELMQRKFRLRRGASNSADGADEAILLSTRMLGRWPNDPQIVTATVRLHFNYIDLLRQRGEEKKLRKENERLLSILEVLFYNPEISDPVKEELIRLQLRQLRLLRRRGSVDDVDALVGKIERELEDYRGAKRDDFRKQLDEAK
jgi:serine/threonine protein kinase